MASGKRTVHIDVVSDTVCPWCYVGKKRLEKAMTKYNDQLNFEVQWRPYMLNPAASKEGVDKMQFYIKKFGAQRTQQMMPHMQGVFRELGLDFKAGGRTGSTLNSHRLLAWAAGQGLDKQNALAEQLFSAYFTQEKFINDRQVLLEAAQKAGLEGAAEYLDDEQAGMQEVEAELSQYAAGVTGVPHFIIDGQWRLSGAQDPAAFHEIFDKLVPAGGN